MKIREDSDSDEERKRSFDESADLIKEGLIEYRASLRACLRKNKIRIDNDKDEIRREMEERTLARKNKKSKSKIIPDKQKRKPSQTATTISKNDYGTY